MWHKIDTFGKTVDIRCSDERITVNYLGIKRHAYLSVITIAQDVCQVTRMIACVLVPVCYTVLLHCILVCESHRRYLMSNSMY